MAMVARTRGALAIVDVATGKGMSAPSANRQLPPIGALVACVVEGAKAPSEMLASHADENDHPDDFAYARVDRHADEGLVMPAKLSPVWRRRCGDYRGCGDDIATSRFADWIAERRHGVLPPALVEAVHKAANGQDTLGRTISPYAITPRST